MIRSIKALSAAVLAAGVLWVPSVATASGLTLTASTPATLLSSVPVVRVTLSSSTITADMLPKLSITPSVVTTWSQVGTSSFQAMVSGNGLIPLWQYTISVPTAISCSSSCTFTATKAVTLTAAGSLTWLDQLLAEANYLPVTFAPVPTTTTSSTTTSPPTTTVATAAPTAGTFTWKYAGLPASAKALWTVGTLNPLVKAALAKFQAEKGLPVTGTPTMWTWKLLLNMVNANQTTSAAYAYVDVSEKSPETMVLYLNGVEAAAAHANTGISAAPSTLGTFYVYLKFRTQTMRGTNPDGSKYNDPGIPFVSYYHQSEALHYFTRPGYGWPQSLGCVELPMVAAAKIWPLTPIGTVVTVHK